MQSIAQCMHLNCAQYVSCTHLHLDMSTWWLQIVYYDGQFDDSRLCLALACTAALAGAAVANHTEATKLLKVSLRLVQSASCCTCSQPSQLPCHGCNPAPACAQPCSFKLEPACHVFSRVALGMYKGSTTIAVLSCSAECKLHLSVTA